MCHRILAKYPGTVAFVVIGSVALGSWEPDSDVDLVWVLRGRRRKDWHRELDYDYSGVVELVPLNISSLLEHLARRSPMAHAIQRGIILYDPDGLVKRLCHTPLGPPIREWMQKWFEFFSQRLDWGKDSYRREKAHHRRFCKDHCICRVTEILTRAVVNLALVFITTKRIVPNSKAEMRLHYPPLIRGPRLRKAMETALKAHHEKRDLTLDEAKELVYLGKWLRARLVGILGEPKVKHPTRRKSPAQAV
jgi:predicted nucleotidyltransferase